MGVEILVDALFVGLKILQANDRRKIAQRTGVNIRGTKGNASRIDQGDLMAILEQQNQIALLGLRMDLLFERLHLPPRYLNALTRSNIQKRGAFLIVKNDMAVFLSPLFELLFRPLDRGPHFSILP